MFIHSIIDDIGAEKALVSLKQDIEERERLKETCKKMITDYQDKIQELDFEIEKLESNIKQALNIYLDSVEMKETKTQFSYQLPSGKIIKKKPQSILRAKDTLIDKVSKEYKKIEIKLNWAEYKRNLEVVDGNVIDKETGEVIEDVEIETKEEEVQIKFI